MATKISETYWSQFSSDFEEKQSFVAGKEVISLTMDELSKEQNLGNVLELGCGTGLYTETLQQISEEITATDFSEEMIKAANQKRGDLDHITFMQANALDLHFEKESFDTVFMANLIHVIEDPEKVIKESCRVLKNGGQIIITSFAMDQMRFFNRISLAMRYLKAFGKPSKESVKEKTPKERIENLLINNGFKISKSKVLGHKEKAVYMTGIKKSKQILR
ncbi:class I SAM-dependent methyltransferase [Sunxiuqinia sp. sy24]|uniref:class I SAM-dependent methyltransferase n=1 Tax=Sunxiuqinia sp. sy24 TaxID=3461495 RepID=UPI0040464691